MFEFFKNKKAGKAIKNILSGCFVFVFIAIAAYGLVAPQTAHALDFQNPIAWFGDKTAGAIGSVFVSIYVGFAIPISAFLLWGSAELLEMTIKYSVLQLGQYIGPGSAVAETWKVLRDFGNMFFIFILLYTAIMTILGMGSGDVKKVVVKVIIMAVLINFSFFFTKVAIDASNIVSIAFYKQIVSSTCNVDPSANQPVFVNIGGAFMCHLGLTKMFSSDTVANLGQYFSNGLDGTAALLRFATLGSALMVMLAIIMFAGCILFLYRFVSILLLLAFSPLAFAAMAFPSDKYSGRWTKPLMEVCISAPVFMLFTWVTLRLAGSLTSGQNGSIVDVISSKAFTDSAANPGLLTQHIQASLNFFVIAAMMVATLMISKEVGAAGAGWGLKTMKSFGGWAQGKLGNATLGTAGYLGRRTIGAAGKAVADGEIKVRRYGLFGEKMKLKDIQKQGGIAGSLAGAVRGTGKSVASSSFDARNYIDGFGKASGKGGYDQYTKDLRKERIETAKSLAPSEDEVEQAKFNFKQIKGSADDKIKSANAEIKAAEDQFEEETKRVLAEVKQIENDIANDELTIKNIRANGGDGAQIQRDIDQKKGKIDSLMKDLNTTKRQAADNLVAISKKKKDAAEVTLSKEQAKLDEILGVSEKDAEKRFKETGTESAKEAEAKIKFNFRQKLADAKIEAENEADERNLLGSQREAFLKRKFKEVENATNKAQKEFIDNYVKEGKAEFIEANKKDSLSKKRAMEYADAVERKTWVKVFDNYLERTRKSGKASVLSGTMYTDASAIRKEFNKSKDDEVLKKLVAEINKEGGGDNKKKEESEDKKPDKKE